MTSSNVSKLLVQVNQIDISAVADKATVQKDKGLFENTLKNVAGSGTSVDVQKVGSNKPKLETKPFDSTTKPSTEMPKADTESVNSKAKLPEKVEAIAEEIKEVIKDELGVSDEELEEAMANLGFTILNLLQPQDLAQLFVELTGEQDSVSLIMDESFKNILDEVTSLTNQLLEETKISFEEIKEYVILTDDSEEIDIPVEQVEVEVPVEENHKTDSIKEELPREEAVISSNATQQIQTEDKENVKVVVEEKPVENEPVDIKPQMENDTNKDAQEFSFTKDDSKAGAAIKQHGEPIIRGDGMIFSEQTQQIQFDVTEEVVTLPTGETVRADSIVNQLVEQARVLNTSESTTMEMTLNPEGLGKIYMEVTQKGNEITAKIFTENDAVKQALENQMANLRLELNQSSTKVTSIEVSVGAHEFERNLEQNAQDESRREDQMNKQAPKRRTRIDLNSLDDLTAVMSEEDMLIATMMRDNGNSLDFQA